MSSFLGYNARDLARSQLLAGNFLAKVYGLNALGLLLTALTAALTLGQTYPVGLYLFAIITFLVAGVGTVFVKGVNGVLTFVACAFSAGVFLGPSLAHYTALNPSLVPTAAGITAVTFLSLTAYVFKTGKDFSAWGGFLFAALSVLVMASIVALFVPANQAVLAGAGVLVFTGYTLYDTSNIVHGRFKADEYPRAAIQLYLDVLNMFLYVLQLLGLWSGPTKD